MPEPVFSPELKILTTSRRPCPILPVDYSFFLCVRLPHDIEDLPLAVQLALVAEAVEARGAGHEYGPFGYVLGHRFRCSPKISIYLNRHGEFLSWELFALSPLRGRGASSIMARAKKPFGMTAYVVGHSSDEFYSLLPAVKGAEANDKNLDAALKFTLLDDAVATSVEHGGSVFEVVKQDGNATLRELLVDLRKVTSIPFEGCYKIGPQLIVGPTFVAPTLAETKERIEALVAAKVTVLVSLLDKAELFYSRKDITRLKYHELFQLHYFPVCDGEAPSRELMQTILNTIEKAVTAGGKVYLHCYGGRGRSGCVAGCALSRAGIATGVRAVNKLAEIRYEHGVFTRAPETAAQREMVIKWAEGQ